MKNLTSTSSPVNNLFASFNTTIVFTLVFLLCFIVGSAAQPSLFLASASAQEENKVENENKEDKDKDEGNDNAKKEETKKEDASKEEPKKEEPKKEEAKPAPESVELKNEPIRITVKLPGTFEAKEPKQIELASEEFGDFKIVEFVGHGQKVNEGDTLIRFDQKKYDEALAEKEKTFRLSEMSLQEEELSLKNLEEKTPMFQEAMMLAKRYADEDFAYYYNVLEVLNEKSRDFYFKWAEFRVELAREELRQLEKMYASDDLVEETEEIILRRTRMELESSERSFESSKKDYERTKEVLKDREDIARKRRARMDELDFQKTKELFPQTLEKAKIALDRKRIAFEKEKESLQKFREDKKWLAIRAPTSGIVYYGDYKEGKWSGAPLIYGQLKVGENVKKGTVLMSVVEPRPSLLRIAVPEKELHWIKSGTEGKVVPTANPELKFETKIFSINEYPGVAGDYTAMLNVDVKESKIVPSMTGNVELVVYDKKETILVPDTALKRVEDEDDSETHGYLFLLKEDNKTEKVKVKTGKTKAGKTEILEGVSVGQKILKTAEKD